MLDSKESCEEFLTTQNAATIARQIRLDHQSSKDGGRASPLIWYLPSSGALADQLINELYPENKKFSRTIRRAQYLGLMQGIKAGLHHWAPPKVPALPDLLARSMKAKPSKNDLETTLRTLEFFLQNLEIDTNTPVEEALKVLRIEYQKLNSPEHLLPATTPPNSAAEPKFSKARKCYICQFLAITPHRQYPSLCQPCGEFNMGSCRLSLPENLNLSGKISLVTGGRVNLGYHTTLRLLRCGAKVIVSTRYPYDAELRYLSEPESENWNDRLKIIGADFRSANDVFMLVGNVREQLREWAGDGQEKLDILINNAAQTLTDPVDKERDAVAKEKTLSGKEYNKGKVLHAGSTYEPRVRGGVPISKLLTSSSEQRRAISQGLNDGKFQFPDFDQSARQVSEDQITRAKTEANDKSSWMQSLHQIPYEDVISAHSVNTFVPLILIRELLPLMGSLDAQKLFTETHTPAKPLGHIINVTSREGIFESSPNHSSKNGKHVHTNLTKAALNMLTETEAGPAWRERKVAMNSVDPGYMSAAPEIERQWQESKIGRGRDGCPIGWEDGAGRVLWPIAAGEMGKPVWGRLLKHFGKVEVNVGVGR